MDEYTETGIEMTLAETATLLLAPLESMRFDESYFNNKNAQMLRDSLDYYNKLKHAADHMTIGRTLSPTAAKSLDYCNARYNAVTRIFRGRLQKLESNPTRMEDGTHHEEPPY
jgi:hypothetical protein